MIYACYRMGYRSPQTVYGFRGLASTWANEAEDCRLDWIEMAFVPAEQAVRGSSNSALYLIPPRRMLQGSGDFITGIMEGEGDRP